MFLVLNGLCLEAGQIRVCELFHSYFIPAIIGFVRKTCILIPFYFSKKILGRALLKLKPRDRHGHGDFTQNEVCPAPARNLGPHRARKSPVITVMIMSAFPRSGHSSDQKNDGMRGSKRPRLCENESIFLTDGTAHHNDFCWRLGDAMRSHIGIRNK